MGNDTEEARRWIDSNLHPERWNGAQATIRCPLPEHQDKKASASVNAEGRVWKCHGCGEGGTLTDLAKRIGVSPPPGLSGSHGLSAARSHAYPYRNAVGKVVFEVVRRRGKAFPIRHRGPDGKEIWRLPDAGHGLLYRLPEMLAAVTAGKPVCVVEGEKDADRLSDLGFAATCNAMGAGKWRAGHSAGIPAGADVVIFPDYDKGGMDHVEKVVTSILKAGTCGSVRVVDLGFEVRAKHGRDISDWLAADPTRGADEIQGLIDAAVSAGDWAAPAPQTTEAPEAPEQATGATNKDERPVVLYEPGERLIWARDAIAKLIEKGEQNDLTSLYAMELVVQGSGAPAGLLFGLYRAPGPEEGAALQTPKSTLLIAQATELDVQANIDEHIRWMRVRKNGERGKADPTRENAKEILTRYKADSTRSRFPRFRTLRGIVDAPTLRTDGTLLSRTGYDPESGLYADFKSGDWPKIPTNPTREDAQEALETLYDLVKESSFRAPYDRAVWVAFLLSIVARNYVKGNVPVFGFSANAPRIGKGTLVDLAAIIATNNGATKWAPVTASRTRDGENEERKRLMAVALSGIRLMCIDNVKAGDLMGTPALDMVITSGDNSEYGKIADRILGVTGIAEANWTCVVAATGNNLRVRGDMGGRTVLCKLETHHVAPEMIQYQHHPDPHQYVRKHRKGLLVAALTVLLAHKLAVDSGEPDTLLPKVGSFGQWSDRIRSAVWWADRDRCDPWDGNAEVKAAAQPEQVEALMFFEAWYNAFGTTQVAVKEIAERCTTASPNHDSDLADAVKMLSIPDPRGADVINTRALGQWLAARKDSPGRYVLREGDRKSGKIYWYVERTLSVVEVLKQSIEDVIAVFPEITGERQEELRTTFHDYEISALDAQYLSAQELETAIMEVGSPLRGDSGTQNEPYANMTEEQRTAMIRFNTIGMLTTMACFMSPTGPVGRDAGERFNKAAVRTYGRENVALVFLRIAEWELGRDHAPGDVEAVVKRAIELKDAELRRNPSKKDYYASDIEDAMRELLGLQATLED